MHLSTWWGWPRAYDVWAVPYTQSTLIVDVIDARTNQLVWCGYDTGTLNTGKPDKTLDSAVNHVVSRFMHDTGKSPHASRAARQRAGDLHPRPRAQRCGGPALLCTAHWQFSQ